ncbi:MAG: glycosyltransferase [Dehalococcoidia bacterium]|nr:glycosyltransferase [Dehalococcoidia bacterium]
MNPRVSVVIPTYRRPDALARCLRAVLAQELGAGAYELIVVDDEPSAETRALVRRLAAPVEAPAPIGLVRAPAHGRGGPQAVPPRATSADLAPQLTYIPMTRAHGPAAARNAGWRAARAPVVAFTDDDCLPLPGWLRAGLEALGAGVSGVDGRVIVPLPPAPTDAQRTLAGLERSRFVTANCFYRRSALVEAGGFDERFRLPWREDSDLYFTLIERGHRFERAPGAVVLHPARPATPWGVSLREQRKSADNALLYRKHPRLYREHVQARPPLRYYAAVAAAACAAVALLRGRRVAAAGGAAAWACLTLEFAAERLRATSRRPSHVAEMVVTSALIPPLSIWWRLRGAWKYRVLFL